MATAPLCQRCNHTIVEAASEVPGAGSPGAQPSSAAIGATFAAAIAEQQEIQTPLCHDCAEILISELDQELALVKKERDTHHEYLQRLRQQEIEPFDDSLLAEADGEERELARQLRELAVERERLTGELTELQRQEASLSELEDRYWQAYTSHQLDLRLFEEERDAMHRRIEVTTDQLERLKNTNVFNDAFHIWYDGHFGTINGFRLGRLPSQPVEWAEINAGWGEAAMLLATLARLKDYDFRNWRILGMGSTSRMLRKSDSLSYELYGANEGIRIFSARRFDQAMVAFLECLKEFAAFVDPSFNLPVPIEDDKIGRFSIKHQMNDEAWTKALKYTLVNLKWLLAWIARQNSSS
eukprot:TRINITY_DN3802_c0_g1_i9.p1 TRINITY_DN3802_c0_g1~~TRINITY_DN3802_c0_g1_i9.p1  ORF type:complete len:354 (-),score=87.21 TRINITY_DN3802_c0_g1_i9:53-1114(-)